MAAHEETAEQSQHLASDAQLLARARGDADAFRDLYERYAERIYAYHRRCSRDGDAAQDLTAETFAQAWLVRSRFRDEAAGSAAPWLYGIARNVLLMSVRRRSLERVSRERLGLLGESAAVAQRAHEPDETWLEELDVALGELSVTRCTAPSPPTSRPRRRSASVGVAHAAPQLSSSRSPSRSRGPRSPPRR